MNAPLRPAWLVRPDPAPPAAPDPAGAAGQTVERHLWHGRFGSILVEVRDGQVYVDGEWVRPAEPDSREAGSGE